MLRKALLLIGLIVIGMLATSCGYTPEEARAFNADSMSNPVCVGEINGQKLYRVEIAREGVERGRNHFVYFTQPYSPVVTLNRAVPEGKYTRHVVEVFIDGKPFVKTNLAEEPVPAR